MASKENQWLDQVGSVLETLNQGVIITNDQRRIVFVNSMFLEMLQRPAEEVFGKLITDLYSPEERHRIQEFIARRKEQGRARYEFYMPQSDGGRLPVAVTARSVRGDDGRAYGIITAVDISDQKSAQMELSRANSLLLERQRQTEHELQLAERVQQSLAPKCLTWGGVSVEAHYQPASSIGGDYGSRHSWRRPSRCCCLRCVWPRYQLSAYCQPHLLRNNEADRARSRPRIHAAASESLCGSETSEFELLFHLSGSTPLSISQLFAVCWSGTSADDRHSTRPVALASRINEHSSRPVRKCSWR